MTVAAAAVAVAVAACASTVDGAITPNPRFSLDEGGSALARFVAGTPTFDILILLLLVLADTIDGDIIGIEECCMVVR